MKKNYVVLLLILVLICSFALSACSGNKKFTITFDANGGEGTMSSLEDVSGEIELSSNVYTKKGHAFKGWALTSDGAVEYADGAKILVEKDCTLYAVWERNEFVISFNPNGGSGEMNNINNAKGEITLPSNAFTRENYAFAGWTDSLNGEIKYANEGKISTNSDITLYAVWTRNLITANVSVAQVAENSKQVEVTWDNSSEKIGKITVVISRKSQEIAKKVITANNEIEAGSTVIDSIYGKVDVNVSIESVDGESKNIYTRETGVTASQYNVAYLNGTFPVSMFTLMMENQDSTDISSTEETYIYLERDMAYDWTKLPGNMHRVPVVDAERHDFYSDMRLTAEWIKELYELNNNSTFTLYFTDNHIDVLCEFFVQNKIPTTAWNAIMFSDGAGTASYVSNTYGTSNGEETYNNLVTAWAEYLTSESPNYKSIEMYSLGLPEYAPVLCNTMTNVKWYSGRMRAGENVTNTTFTSSLITALKSNGFKEFYLNNLLNALDETEKEQFKALYHIDENTFIEAREQGKKVMMILGTSWSGEAGSLENYINMTMAIYGDEYVYYYKGHPGYPTSAYPDRKEIIDRINQTETKLYELDHSVAAEFFLFFFEDIEMIGYSSSTFASGTDANAAGVWGQDTSYQYASLLETFLMSVTKDSLETTYGVTLTEGHTYYLVKYTDTMAVNKTIGIYDVTDGILTNYFLDGENYVEV